MFLHLGNLLLLQSCQDRRVNMRESSDGGGPVHEVLHSSSYFTSKSVEQVSQTSMVQHMRKLLIRMHHLTC